MQAGKLTRRITIQEAATWTTNTFGERSLVWSNVETVCSEKRDLSSRELFQASQVYADVTTMFRIRYRAGLNTKMRIYYDGRYYNIRSIIDPSDRRRELHIMCTGGAT